MATKSQELIRLRRPEYMRQFRCIGGACEENCCAHRWLIYIDKTTYKKYQKIKDKTLRPLLDTHIIRNKKNLHEQDYAQLSFGDKTQCAFLTEQKLCKIQLEMGEEYLSTVCRMYPRVRNLVDGVWEECVDTSCPQAARDILLFPDGLGFEEVESRLSMKDRLPKTILKTAAFADNPAAYMWDLRTFTIQVLKTREYQLWERLVVLGIFYHRVSRHIKEKQAMQIPGLIELFTQMIVDGSFKTELTTIPSQINVQVDILKWLADERLLYGVQSKAYLECYQEFLQGLGFSGEDSQQLELAKVKDYYTKAYAEVYAPFMQDREYILENYLVNYVFKEVFPATHKEVWEAYVQMTLQYAMIKLQLIGIAGHQKSTFSEDSIVKLVFSFGKVIEHSGDFLRKVQEKLSARQYNTLPFMAILIKN